MLLRPESPKDKLKDLKIQNSPIFTRNCNIEKAVKERKGRKENVGARGT